jgi:hypothetical protein
MNTTGLLAHCGFLRERPKLVASWSCALIVLTTSALAHASGVGVYVEGPQAVSFREALVAGVPKGLVVADGQSLGEALAEQGQRGPFGKSLDAAGSKHEAAIARVHEAASSMGLAAILVAQVTKEKGTLRVRLWVVEASGAEQGPEEVVMDGAGNPRRNSELRATVEELLVPYKSTSPPPQQPRPTPEEPPPPVESSAALPSSRPSEDLAPSQRPRGLVARSLFSAELGADAAGRHFEYNDGITSNLRSYDVLPAALASASIEFFPLAEEKGFLRDIGFVGSYARSLYLGSNAGAGVSIHTVDSSISAGVRVRLHPWGDAGAIIGVSDGYASQAVTFDSAGEAIDGQVPAVNYQANRTGVDARIPLGSFAITAGAGFRAVVDAGPVAQRFRLSSVDGVDAELGVTLSVTRGWEARLLGDYERYFYSFKPVPGDAFVAGGALDQFFGGTFAIAYIF